MPRIESQVVVNLDIDTAFLLSQTYGDIRSQWDVFIKSQRLLPGFDSPQKGARTLTRSRHGFKMVSEYVSYNPPEHVGMKMVSGPWFFKSFSGGWNFRKLSDDEISVTWRYNFICKPMVFKPILEFIGAKILKRDIDRRLSAFRAACEDDAIIKLLRS